MVDHREIGESSQSGQVLDNIRCTVDAYRRSSAGLPGSIEEGTVAHHTGGDRKPTHGCTVSQRGPPFVDGRTPLPVMSMGEAGEAVIRSWEQCPVISEVRAGPGSRSDSGHASMDMGMCSDPWPGVILWRSVRRQSAPVDRRAPRVCGFRRR